MKPALLILAAGIGSRYGSMKQTEKFGPSGETITDYSIYDALRAGFGRVIFVISPSMEEEFKTSYVKKFPSSLDISYVIQSINDIPAEYKISPDRKKPWGTAHALLMAKGKINEPFAVINADDFYGKESYEIIASFFKNTRENKYLEFCIAGYPIRNTLSKHGTVSRGVCAVDEKGFLTAINERTKVFESNGKIFYLDQNDNQTELSSKSLVSMNMFGFSPGIFSYLQEHFLEFIAEKHNDPKAEFLIPEVLDRLTKREIARIQVLRTNATWFGVTYKEDRPFVLDMIKELVKKGVYPVSVWN